MGACGSIGMSCTQSKSAMAGPRHVCSRSGGKPTNAIAFADGAGTGAFTDPCPLILEHRGVNVNEWSHCLHRLRDTWDMESSAGLVRTIENLNREVFKPNDMVAVYAEYGMSERSYKAMTVYTKEIWDSLPA